MGVKRKNKPLPTPKSSHPSKRAPSSSRLPRFSEDEEVSSDSRSTNNGSTTEDDIDTIGDFERMLEHTAPIDPSPPLDQRSAAFTSAQLNTVRQVVQAFHLESQRTCESSLPSSSGSSSMPSTPSSALTAEQLRKVTSALRFRIWTINAFPSFDERDVWMKEVLDEIGIDWALTRGERSALTQAMQNAKSQIRNICSDPMKFYEGDDAADLLRNDAFLVANNTSSFQTFLHTGLKNNRGNFEHPGFIKALGRIWYNETRPLNREYGFRILTPAQVALSATVLLSTLQKQKFEQERYEHSYVHFKTFIESKSRRKPDWLEDLSKLAGPKAFALSAGVSSKTSEAGQRRDFVESDPVEPEAV